MSVIVFVCVLGGTFFGIYLRNRLPHHHMSGATKDVVRLGTGLISHDRRALRIPPPTSPSCRSCCRSGARAHEVRSVQF